MALTSATITIPGTNLETIGYMLDVFSVTGTSEIESDHMIVNITVLADYPDGVDECVQWARTRPDFVINETA